MTENGSSHDADENATTKENKPNSSDNEEQNGGFLEGLYNFVVEKVSFSYCWTSTKETFLIVTREEGTGAAYHCTSEIDGLLFANIDLNNKSVDLSVPINIDDFNGCFKIGLFDCSFSIIVDNRTYALRFSEEGITIGTYYDIDETFFAYAEYHVDSLKETIKKVKDETLKRIEQFIENTSPEDIIGIGIFVGFSIFVGIGMGFANHEKGYRPMSMAFV